MSAVIEVRTYRTTAGSREVLIEALRTRAFPYQRRLGVKLLGPFPLTDDPDAFVWLRAFPNAESRDGLKNAFYESDFWRLELEPELMPLISDYSATVVSDEFGLWERWPDVA